MRDRRGVLRMLIVVLALLAGWLLANYFMIVAPAVQQPDRADAIMVLGPSLDNRLDEAVDIARRYGITELAVSVGDTPAQSTGGYCGTPPAGISVTCFVPNPYTTRGEARELGRLATQHGWTSVIVIAPRPQLSRARFLVRRCFGGRLEMVASPDTFSFGALVSQYVYQSGALAKAVLESGC